MTYAPLAGFRVVEFGQFIAAPGAGQILADLGADVIKVETRSGDAARTAAAGDAGDSMFVAYNRGKRSLSIDLKDPDGCAIALDLIGTADVLISNMSAGVMERLGLGPNTCAERRPELIYIAITGYPSGGPWEGRRCFDIAAQAESGIMSVTGSPESGPTRVGFMVVDAATAAHAATAALAALVGRERSGVGVHLGISLFDVGISLQAQLWAEFAASGREPQLNGNKQPLLAPASDVVSVADGKVVLSAYLPAHWAQLCTAIGRADLIDDERFRTNEDRVAHRPEMLSEIEAGVGSLTMDECVQLLDDHGVVCGAIRSYERVSESPAFKDAGLLVKAEDGRRDSLWSVALPYRIDGETIHGGNELPRVGGDSVSVLRELGYSDGNIEILVDSGTVTDGRPNATVRG